ncbi:Homocysteine-responsive endoplasmic reticulum-resident ubiquitin-like domain member 2 protein [Eumeta japonica]|uniref:Homocysteine-responsive endoplasmic reticulum-resident ubiquitin-like domain member 2 protein n=1 Tax=Eumeta variegata TaxID=151549 RepID=A0A4C1WXM1_EUMVA|nr:Homocysteine-responsive endoplasmic reticulum-resident ubiquitin-like domain member 2 protein [Eumeta japonica]
MIPESVTLVVKAPNQQIEDQNIECQSSWTVAQLKGHLSQNTDEQKIIYSGQLLEDNTILKDVLRKYDSQIAHTMHLVCTPKRQIAVEQTKKPEAQNEGIRRRTTSPENPESENRVETNRPETRQNDQNHSVEMQNYFSSFANNYGRVPPYPNYSFGTGYLPVPNDPAAMANHMMMIQQAYIQYMQQYANM